MRRFDYKCPTCGHIKRDVLIPSHDTTDEYIRCPEDGTRCERLPAAPAFKVNGFNAANRYSKEGQ